MTLSKVPNEYLPLPTTTLPGAVYPDGTTIKQDSTGKISASIALGSDTPAPETVAATGGAGTSALAAREDHGHAMPGYATATSGGFLSSTQYGLIQSAEQTANKAQPNGYASLDASGKIPIAQIPASVVGALEYQGTWNASTNSPALASGTGTKGFYYKVGTAGTTTLDGNSVWHVGDWAVFDGSTWDKIDNYEAVSSVAGRVGAITLTTSDVSGLGTAALLNVPSASGGTATATQVVRGDDPRLTQAGFTPAAVAVPSSVVYEAAEYNTAGTTMYPIYAIGYPSSMAGGAVDYIEYGFSTSTSTQPTSWTAAGKPRTIKSASGIASGYTEVCWVRFRSLVTAGATPGTSAAVSSAAQSFVTQTTASGGGSGSSSLTAYTATNTALANGGSIVISHAGDPPPYKRRAMLFSRTPAPWMLLHFDGTNGSTTITDATGNNTVTVTGTAALSTSQYKFGTASLALGAGTNAFASVANSTNFDINSQDFTLECFVYVLSAPTTSVGIFDRRSPSNGNSGWALYIYLTSSNVAELSFVAGVNSGGWSVSMNGSIVSVGTWHHVAITKQGTTYRLFLDGALSVSQTSSATIPTLSAPVTIGNFPGGGGTFPGYIDEMRYTAGVALYTATFTPPSAAFGSAQVDTLVPGAIAIYTDATDTTLVNNTGGAISAYGEVLF